MTMRTSPSSGLSTSRARLSFSMAEVGPDTVSGITPLGPMKNPVAIIRDLVDGGLVGCAPAATGEGTAHALMILYRNPHQSGF